MRGGERARATTSLRQPGPGTGPWRATRSHRPGIRRVIRVTMRAQGTSLGRWMGLPVRAVSPAQPSAPRGCEPQAAPQQPEDAPEVIQQLTAIEEERFSEEEGRGRARRSRRKDKTKEEEEEVREGKSPGQPR